TVHDHGSERNRPVRRMKVLAASGERLGSRVRRTTDTTRLRPKMSWMDRGLPAAAFVTTTLLVAGPGLAKPPPAKAAAAAGPRDKAALRIDEEALGKDYLETNFIRAEKRLEQAISLCGKAACSPGVLAQLYRDLAVVQLAGLSKVDAAKDDLKKALEL